MAEQDVAVLDRRPALGRGEVTPQEGFLLLELGLGLLQLVLIRGVGGVTETVERSPHGLPDVVEHPDLALELRVPHGVPAGYLSYLFLVVKDARGPPLVGYAVPVIGIEG